MSCQRTGTRFIENVSDDDEVDPSIMFLHWNPNSIAGTVLVQYKCNILFTEDFLLCADRSHMWRRCQPIRWTCCWWIRLTCWPESRGDPGPDTLRRKGWGQFFGLLWLRVTDWMQKTKWAEAEESCCCPHFRCLYCSTCRHREEELC